MSSSTVLTQLKKVAVSESPFSIQDLTRLHQNNQIIFNTEYQRSEVWKIKKKQLLLDSILRGYDINKIFLRQGLQADFECLDGQQRLRAIFEFLDDEYRLRGDYTPELGPKLFSELAQDVQWAIRGYVLKATLVHNTDDETTSDIFLRLQEGTPLNSAEKLNAMQGYFRTRMIDESRHPLFNATGIADYRFAHRFLAAQLIRLELSPIIAEAGFRNLKVQFEMHRTVDIPRPTLDQVTRVLNFIQNALGQDTKTIQYRADLVSLYLLVSHLVKTYVLSGRENDFRAFVKDFFLKLATTPDKHYVQYAVARGSAIDSRYSLQTRYDVILGKFLLFVPTIVPKDPNRLFDEGECLALYYREDGKCKVCGKDTPLDQGHAHHKLAHSLGGPTTIDNGQWLCAHCNQSLGATP